MMSRHSTFCKHLNTINSTKHHQLDLDCPSFGDLKCWYGSLFDSKIYQQIINPEEVNNWPKIILDSNDLHSDWTYLPMSEKCQIPIALDDIMTELVLCIPDQFWLQMDSASIQILIHDSKIHYNLPIKYFQLMKDVYVTHDEIYGYRINLLPFLGNQPISGDMLKYDYLQINLVDCQHLTECQMGIKYQKGTTDQPEHHYSQVINQITYHRSYQNPVIYRSGLPHFDTIIVIDDGLQELISIEFQIYLLIGNYGLTQTFTCLIPAQEIHQIINDQHVYVLNYTTISECSHPKHIDNYIHGKCALHMTYVDQAIYKFNFKNPETTHKIDMYHRNGNILNFNQGMCGLSCHCNY